MTPTPTSTPTPTPSVGHADIFSFQTCCYPYTKFRINDVHASVIVGQTFLLEGGTFTDAICAQVISYEETGDIYNASGVTFLEQDDCNDVDCPSCPPVLGSESIMLLSEVTCTCISYNVTNTYDFPQEIYYTDCYDNNVSQSVDAFQTISICACEDTVVFPTGVFITATGECPPVSPTPEPTPSVTPTISPSPSSGWNLCDEDFCFVTYDPELDLYNGTYTVSGSGVYNDRRVYEGDVLGIIYYNSTTQQWCLSDSIGGSCLFGGPTPSTSSCPDLWDVVFTSGVCNTTTSTTSPCDVFDFVAYFDCDVPETPTPTPTNSPTPTFTPTPTPSVDICNFVSGDISISAYTTTTTTIHTTTTTTTICYEPLSGDVTFTLVETIFVCPGDNYQFTSCDGGTVYYIEPSNSFIDVDLITGFTYSMNINGVNGCFTFDGATTVSPNGSVTGDIILFSNCDECEFVTPSATPTSTVTPTPTITSTPTVTPTVSVSQTITPTPTESLSVTSTPTVTPTGTETILVSPSPTPTLTQTPTTTPLPAFLDGSSCYNFYLSHANNTSGVVCSTVQTPTGFINYYRSDCDYQTVFVDGDPTGCTVYINDGITAVGNGILSDGCRYWETDASGQVISGPNVCSGASGCCTA